MSSVRQIALHAGCSSSTVSLVLRGDSSISEATAKRVLEAATKLKYKYSRKRSSVPADPNQRHFVLVTGTIVNSPIEVYSAAIYGISDACRELGVRLSLHQLKTADCVESLSAMACDGLIYGMGDCAIEQALIARIRKPVLKIMSIPGITWPYDHVTLNNPIVGRIAGNYLIKQGHCRVGMIGYDNDICKERINEARAIIEQNGGMADSLLLPQHAAPSQRDELTKVFFVALRTKKVTALFSPDDSLTVSVYQLLLRQGIRPGEDIQVISCNNDNILAQLHPRPLSVDIHPRSIGRMAVRQLLWRLENPDETAITVLMTPTLKQEN